MCIRDRSSTARRRLEQLWLAQNNWLARSEEGPEFQVVEAVVPTVSLGETSLSKPRNRRSSDLE
eukprot:14706369-Alexandrium_andersonii.AAC.1